MMSLKILINGNFDKLSRDVKSPISDTLMKFDGVTSTDVKIQPPKL